MRSTSASQLCIQYPEHIKRHLQLVLELPVLASPGSIVDVDGAGGRGGGVGGGGGWRPSGVVDLMGSTHSGEKAFPVYKDEVGEGDEAIGGGGVGGGGGKQGGGLLLAALQYLQVGASLCCAAAYVNACGVVMCIGDKV